MADFYCLATRTPIKAQFLKPPFQQLIQAFSPFFTHNSQGWVVSELGQFIAEQYLACKKLNRIPQEMQHGNCKLTIIENEAQAKEYSDDELIW